MSDIYIIVEDDEPIEVIEVAEQGPPGPGSGGGSADVAATINEAASKPTPADDDRFVLTDSASSFALRKLTWANIKSAAKTYFDTLYAAIIHTHAVADISNVGHAKILGRHGAGTGTAQEIGIDGGLELHGGNLRRAALTGFIEASAGSGTTTLSASAASEGGNGAADAGKLLKFGASGDIKADSVTAYSAASEGGCALFPTEIAIFNGLTSTLLSTLATDLRSVVFKDAAGTVAFMSDIPDISTKQDTLVSGTNIKTVAGQSLLGSTNIPALLTDPTGITGAAALTNIVSLTQAQYDAIGSKSSTTLYVIT